MRGLSFVYRRLAIPAVALAFLASSCTVTLVRFDAPGAVAVGALFDVVIVGSGTNGSPFDQVGCALQVPNGFTVEETCAVGGVVLGTTPTAMTSLISPESSSTVAFAAATVVGPTVGAVRFRVRAPRTPGVYSLKTILAATAGGAWSVNAPAASGGNFAAVTTAPYVRSVTVSTVPNGLPIWRPQSSGIQNFSAASYSQFDFGFGVGDFDADGRTDIVAGQPRGATPPALPSGTALLHRGRVVEGWTTSAPFGPINVYYGIAAGDFNADGIDDVYVSGTPFLGQAAGAPSQMQGLPFGAVNIAASADFDLNGFSDIAGAGGPPVVYFSYAGGTMVPSTAGLPTTTIPDVAGVDVPDFDGDGDPDLLILRSSGLEVYRNDQALGFAAVAPPSPPTVGQAFRFADAADADGDGDADLLLGIDGLQPAPGFISYASAALAIYRNDGTSWTVQPTTGLPAIEGYGAAVLADVDSDGLADIVTARSTDGPSQTDLGRIEIYRNLGGLTFSRAVALESGFEAGGLGDVFRILHRDVDDDGLADLTLVGVLGVAVYSRVGPCETACASGVGNALGLAVDVLFVNGRARDPVIEAVAVGLSQPITIALAQSPFAALPSRFVIYGEFGWPLANQSVSTILGVLPFAPPVLSPGNPSVFTLANSFGSDASALLQATAPGAFAFTLAGGLPVPFVFTLGAIIDDPSSPTFGLALANTVVVDVR